MNIVINSIKQESTCDGPGLRLVLFLQGCNVRCPGCHNKASWDINKGHIVDIDCLVEELRKKSINKKITISGGEPLMQQEALIVLLNKIQDFDIALYTSYEETEVSSELKGLVSHLKTGKFIISKKTTVKPFVGSTNQEFRRIK